MLNDISAWFSGFERSMGLKYHYNNYMECIFCKCASRTTQNWEYDFMIKVSKTLKIFIDPNINQYCYHILGKNNIIAHMNQIIVWW